MDNQRLLTIPATAKALGIGVGRTYELVHTRQIASLRVGSRVYVPAASIDDFISERLEKAEAEAAAKAGAEAPLARPYYIARAEAKVIVRANPAITGPQLAILCKVTLPTVHNWVKSGLIPPLADMLTAAEVQ